VSVIEEGSGHAFGKQLRGEVPRSSHGRFAPAHDRPDPVAVLTSQNETRIQWLVPVRHWRMAQSPFAFYRGAAKLMALDLATTPATGLQAQICGDAHLANFGAYGSPERELVFDLNDFDETVPGPWEWDVKRLVASFAIAARHNGLDAADETDLAATASATYRGAMSEFAQMRYLEAWYAHLSVDDIFEAFADELTKKERRSAAKFSRKARAKDSLHSLSKLAEKVNGEYRIKTQPPLLIPAREFPIEEDAVEIRGGITTSLADYLASVPDHLEVLLRRFQLRDIALKVVGVGSVGTRCSIVLLQGRDAEDPFFLQVKEASRSVLADHLPESVYANQGQRVVVGQRLMQAASDSFLGWTRGTISGTHYYWRQLKDMKASPETESASLVALRRFAVLCGWTLARAHARSGDSRAIAGYVGGGDVFDRAMADFAVAYADQNESDYAAFTAAIESGAVAAHE